MKSKYDNKNLKNPFDEIILPFNLYYKFTCILNLSLVIIKMTEQNIIKEILYPKRPRYPAINIYSSPRVFQQKIDHKSRPLCIYTGPI